MFLLLNNFNSLFYWECFQGGILASVLSWCLPSTPKPPSSPTSLLCHVGRTINPDPTSFYQKTACSSLYTSQGSSFPFIGKACLIREKGIAQPQCTSICRLQHHHQLYRGLQKCLSLRMLLCKGIPCQPIPSKER